MVAPTICKAVREQWREKPPLHKGAFCLCKHCEVHGENSFPTIFLKKGLQFAKRCAIITPAFKRGGVAQLVEYWSPKPRVVGSNPPAPAMLCGQNRSARENKRKREISKDFSRFFVPAFFRKNTDPFCDFFRPQGSEPAKTGFSKISETELNSRKDLNPRQDFRYFRFSR